jgi:hypothetical protein
MRYELTLQRCSVPIPDMADRPFMPTAKGCSFDLELPAGSGFSAATPVPSAGTPF